MSASREKKIRQDRVAEGIHDPKLARKAEEMRKERRTNRMYAAIGIVFVVVAALLLTWNSGIIQRKTTAATIDGQKFTAADVSYYYTTALNSVSNSSYASYMGLDTQSPLDQQELSDMAKMLLGVSEDMTWDDYLRQAALDSLKQVTMTVKAAKEADFTFTDAMQEEVDSTLDSLASYAKQNGYSTRDYLKAVYGNTMTMDTFKNALHNSVLASHYQEDYQNSLTYTDDQIAAYYKDNKADFDVADYETVTFNGTAQSTTDADGNTVEPTEAETAAAADAAKTAADAALSKAKNGTSLEDIAKDVDIASYASEEAGSSLGTVVTDWVFDTARQAGDMTVLNDDSTYYLVVFHKLYRYDYNTVNVRHILFQVDTSALDSESETYDADVQALKDEAKAKAEDALAQWKSGEATEDSFAALANELSEDSGSNTNGGLYTQIYKGQMVTNFNDWIFDSARKPGDTGIVDNDGSYVGYHVIYFVGEDAPYWQVQVRQTMQSKDYSDWANSLVADVTVEQGSGMKYVH